MLKKPIARSNFSDFLSLYFQGNVSRCAKALGLSRPTVYKYLKAQMTPPAVAVYLEELEKKRLVKGLP